jgi:hypothetical protein
LDVAKQRSRWDSGQGRLLKILWLRLIFPYTDLLVRASFSNRSYCSKSSVRDFSIVLSNMPISGENYSFAIHTSIFTLCPE